MDHAEKFEEVAGGNRGKEDLHVLVVDDEQIVREIVTTYLAIDGHTVETAANGLEGLEKFRADEFDVVITDWKMPKMSGDKLASVIKQVAPNKPIIMITGFERTMKAADSISTNVDLILNKPLTRAEFQDALKKVIARSEAERRMEAKPREARKASCGLAAG